MALKVSLSFKEEEKAMYDFLQSQLSPSIYIKTLIVKEMAKEQGDRPTTTRQSQNDMFSF